MLDGKLGKRIINPVGRFIRADKGFEPLREILTMVSKKQASGHGKVCATER